LQLACALAPEISHLNVFRLHQFKYWELDRTGLAYVLFAQVSSLLSVASVLLYFRVVSGIHLLHLLLVLTLSRNVDAEAESKALRISTLRLHLVDVASGGAGVTFEKT